MELLRRSKLLDAASSSAILLLFSVFLVAMVLSDSSRRFKDSSMQTAYISILIISWPVFAVGLFPLFFYWRKDRQVDKEHLSTASARHLSIIQSALFLATISGLLVFVGLLLNTIDRFQRGNASVIIGFQILTLIVILWVVYTFVTLGWHARQCASSVRDFGGNIDNPHVRSASAGPFDLSSTGDPFDAHREALPTSI